MSVTQKEKKTDQQEGLTIDEVRAIAKEAYVYGFPLVDNYRIQYSYFEDRGNAEYKVPWKNLATQS